jgi:uncharacterized membrane protein
MDHSYRCRAVTKRLWLSWLALCSGLIASAASAGAPPRYHAIEILPMPREARWQYAIVTGVNNRAQVIGTESGGQSFLWHYGTMADISDGLNPHHYVYAINGNGAVVGENDSGAFIWKRGALTQLPHPASAIISTAYSINDKEQIVGRVTLARPSDGFGCDRPVLWERRSDGNYAAELFAGSEVDLCGPAADINDKGHVVFSLSDLGSNVYANIYKRGVITKIPELQFALQITNRGHLVGGLSDPEAMNPWVVWQDGNIVNLVGADFGQANVTAISDNGKIAVGEDFARSDDGNGELAIWIRGEKHYVAESIASSDTPIPDASQFSLRGISPDGRLLAVIRALPGTPDEFQQFLLIRLH